MLSEPCFCRYVDSLDARIPLQSKQSMPNHVQIGQRTGHEQSIGVLRETAVAHLGKTEDALDDADGMLDLGPLVQAIEEESLATNPGITLRASINKSIVPVLAVIGSIAIVEAPVSNQTGLRQSHRQRSRAGHL